MRDECRMPLTPVVYNVDGVKFMYDWLVYWEMSNNIAIIRGNNRSQPWCSWSCSPSPTTTHSIILCSAPPRSFDCMLSWVPSSATTSALCPRALGWWTLSHSSIPSTRLALTHLQQGLASSPWRPSLWWGFNCVQIICHSPCQMRWAAQCGYSSFWVAWRFAWFSWARNPPSACPARWCSWCGSCDRCRRTPGCSRCRSWRLASTCPGYGCPPASSWAWGRSTRTRRSPS